jgi:Tfp pilus assembly protein PilN
MTMTHPPLDLNLLPDQYRGRRLRWWHLLLALVVVGAVISLVPHYLLLRQQQLATETVQAQRDQTLELINALDLDEDELSSLNQRIDEARARLTALEEEAAFLRTQKETLTPAIITAVERQTEEISLTALRQQADQLLVEGETNGQLQVLNYARALQESGTFTNVQIEVMREIEPSDPLQTIAFTIILEE